MQLSIVIVNYNVKHFLQQCLSSVFNALSKIDAEVWVVDNNSVDGSVLMVKNQFKKVKLIVNKDNLGFSKANNQAIKKSKGKYILLLNPDTIVEETTFEKIVDFMDKHPNAGGLGVNMIDGKGKFLPESKRGIPTPKVAFYKMFGLTKLFSKSKKFAKYYMGHLKPDETNKVEILSGAFMLLRKTVIDEIGMLDETFFMYGEDIDLSYRILQAGYDNYYFAETTIVHYKGESTKKGSLNYVFIFYNAMIIFAQKHFGNNNAKLFIFFIKMAIFLRAGMSIARRVWNKISLPLLDFSLIFTGFYFFVPIWEKFHLETVSYPKFIWIMLAVYIIIWMLASFFYGSYDNPIKLKSIFKGVSLGTIIILVVYSLIGSEYRFSRIIILIGATYSVFIMYSVRYVLSRFNKISNINIYSNRKKRILIVGELEEAKRVCGILKQISTNIDVLGFISPNLKDSEDFLGRFEQIEEIISIFKANEIVFCSKDLSSENIISRMLKLSNQNVSIKIAPEDSSSIIGSNSINKAGDLYTVDLNTITTKFNRRLKLFLDYSISTLFLILFPIVIFFVRNKKSFTKNIFLVLVRKKSWVGFADTSIKYLKDMPKILPGVLSPADSFHNKKNINEKIKHNLNISYAKNYKISTDLFIIWKGIFKK